MLSQRLATLGFSKALLISYNYFNVVILELFLHFFQDVIVKQLFGPGGVFFLR